MSVWELSELSFSSDVRNELARTMPELSCCHLAEVAGMALQVDGEERLDFSLGNAAAARKVFMLLEGTGASRPQLTVNRKRRNPRYHVQVDGFPGIMNPDSKGLPKSWCCQRAYLRGAFLAYGSMTAPDRMYHLEMSVKSKEDAATLVFLLSELGVGANWTPKRRAYVVYVKDGDHISEFLRLVGAHRGLLRLENVRVLKGVKNQVNRLVNAETANVDKTVEASMRQVAAIKYLDVRIGIEGLPQPLRTVARARLAMPYASMSELGENLEPRLSKSAVNYRLRKLRTMAKEMGFQGHEEG